jgi:hypothetical protein
MSDLSPNLVLPYPTPAQGQKHATVNEAFQRLDAPFQATVQSAVLTAQSTNPIDGACFVLLPGKTSAAWGSMTVGSLAYSWDGVLEEVTPKEEWRIAIKGGNTVLVRQGEARRRLAPAANLVLNSGFALNQRGVSAAASCGNGLERWLVLAEAGYVGVSQVAIARGGAAASI